MSKRFKQFRRVNRIEDHQGPLAKAIYALGCCSCECCGALFNKYRKIALKVRFI